MKDLTRGDKMLAALFATIAVLGVVLLGISIYVLFRALGP